ncbi:MAG: PTS sugar transporter subunit IIA [Nocardioidaceae bacterium]
MSTTSVVLIGHAGYARGALEAVEMILGPQPGVRPVSMQPDKDPAEVVAEVREVADQTLKADEDRLLILADMFGGSPANAVAAAFLSDPRVGLVTGMNLPMLLETLIEAGAGGDVTATAVRAGTDGVVDAGARLRSDAG